MTIQVGYEFIYNFPQATPMILTLNVHYSRASDIVVPDQSENGPFGPDHRISGRIRKLVQPDRRAAGTNANSRPAEL